MAWEELGYKRETAIPSRGKKSVSRGKPAGDLQGRVILLGLLVGVAVLALGSLVDRNASNPPPARQAPSAPDPVEESEPREPRASPDGILGSWRDGTWMTFTITQQGSTLIEERSFYDGSSGTNALREVPARGISPFIDENSGEVYEGRVLRRFVNHASSR